MLKMATEKSRMEEIVKKVSDKELSSHACPLCGNSYSSEEDLKKHIKNNTQRHTCPTQGNVRSAARCWVLPRLSTDMSNPSTGPAAWKIVRWNLKLQRTWQNIRKFIQPAISVVRTGSTQASLSHTWKVTSEQVSENVLTMRHKCIYMINIFSKNI